MKERNCGSGDTFAESACFIGTTYIPIKRAAVSVAKRIVQWILNSMATGHM